MGVLRYALHSKQLRKVAELLANGLVWLYTLFEMPLLGMSLNPSRSFSTAVAAGNTQRMGCISWRRWRPCG